jgi:uncharacterized lipoprotein YajG
MKTANVGLASLVSVFLITGCSSPSVENNFDTPSPSSQTSPSSPSNNETEDESELSIEDEVNNTDNRYPTEDLRFLEIFEEVGEGNNDSRFNRLAELLDSKFLTLEEVDKIYLLVEQGSNEELAYQLYLYELSLKNNN